MAKPLLLDDSEHINWVDSFPKEYNLYLDAILLRSIHPDYIKDGLPTWRAFKPTPMDKGKVSVRNGTADYKNAKKKAMCFFEERTKKYINKKGKESGKKVYGILGVTVRDLLKVNILPVIKDIQNNKENKIGNHVSLNYRMLMDDVDDIENRSIMEAGGYLLKNLTYPKWLDIHNKFSNGNV